ncbi:HNH endonuclease [Lacibacter sp.]|uniref:HNH endonuclease n=1 Tax=Lacibacter sp. TaxID=1915409 RepID=UPI002B4B13C3|nr:HNH endonuclease [Lacibacter sp.]HLP39738.1 HNH endonuclease [Lacibacter sp.]
MKFYLGVTDNNWFNFLASQNREDVNFWQPGGNTTFKVLTSGAPFLFKLKSPINVIGGIGFFSSHTFLPISIAWDAFGRGNGCESYQDLQRMIFQYRQDRITLNPTIGCIVLTNPIFFSQEDWIEVPEDWSKSIVQGKSYTTETATGKVLWEKIDRLLQKYLYPMPDEAKSQLILEESETPMYGKSVLTKVRLGQGAFRVLVTDAYSRKCAISGEKTLPVLEAAHIKPYAESGPHFISNALLLRSDLHKLFDSGYLTISPDLKVEVSKRIKEEFQNGKEYYKFHGASLYNLPNRVKDKPEERFIEWHNEHIFKG